MQTTMMCLKAEGKEPLALRTFPVILKNRHRKLVYALLGDASTQTYVNQCVGAELGLTDSFETLKVNV